MATMRSQLALYTRHHCDRRLMMASLMATEVKGAAACV
jgi:hypothetical protein